MINSPLQPNVRGLNEALEFLDKEDVMPLLIVAVRVEATGMKTVILDASPQEGDEDVRVALMNAVLMQVAAKMRG